MYEFNATNENNTRKTYYYESRTDGGDEEETNGTRFLSFEEPTFFRKKYKLKFSNSPKSVQRRFLTTLKPKLSGSASSYSYERSELQTTDDSLCMQTQPNGNVYMSDRKSSKEKCDWGEWLESQKLYPYDVVKNVKGIFIQLDSFYASHENQTITKSVQIFDKIILPYLCDKKIGTSGYCFFSFDYMVKSETFTLLFEFQVITARSYYYQNKTVAIVPSSSADDIIDKMKSMSEIVELRELSNMFAFVYYLCLLFEHQPFEQLWTKGTQRFGVDFPDLKHDIHTMLLRA